jgi:hypothetical protein
MTASTPPGLRAGVNGAPGNCARPRSAREEYAGRLVAALTSLNLEGSFTCCKGLETWSATARARGVEPYVGRTVWLMSAPGRVALYWHWQRPFRNRDGFPVARWFQPFCPATEHDQAAAMIAAAIAADIRKRTGDALAEPCR